MRTEGRGSGYNVAVNGVCGYTSKLVPLDTSGNGAWYKMYFN